MSTRYFTADLHLGHRAIIDHCHRPFATVEDMDAALIANINDSRRWPRRTTWTEISPKHPAS